MRDEITTKGLAPGSVFKLLFIGYVLSLGPLIVIFGIFSLFGAETIHVNGEAVKGIAGLIASLIMAPLFAVIWAAITWLFIEFGQWLFSRFTTIKYHYNKVANKTDTTV